MGYSFSRMDNWDFPPKGKRHGFIYNSYVHNLSAFFYIIINDIYQIIRRHHSIVHGEISLKKISFRLKNCWGRQMKISTYIAVPIEKIWPPCVSLALERKMFLLFFAHSKGCAWNWFQITPNGKFHKSAKDLLVQRGINLFVPSTKILVSFVLVFSM